jgi:hypothetical protein
VSGQAGPGQLRYHGQCSGAPLQTACTCTVHTLTHVSWGVLTQVLVNKDRECAYSISLSVRCLSSDKLPQLVSALTTVTPCASEGPFRTTCDRLRRNGFTLVSAGEGAVGSVGVAQHHEAEHMCCDAVQGEKKGWVGGSSMRLGAPDSRRDKRSARCSLASA